MSLLDDVRKAQDTIFKATQRRANWIRFGEGSELHKAIIAGGLEGVTEVDIETCTDGALIVRVPEKA